MGDRCGNKRMIGDLISVPVLAGTVVKEATIVVLTADGYAKPGEAGADLKCCGVALEYCDNTSGDNGDMHVTTDRGVYLFRSDGTIKETDILKQCYIAGPDTVTLTADGASVAGTILGIEDGYVIIDFRG